MSDIGRAKKAVIARILDGDGAASHAQRRAAFDGAGLTGAAGALVQKVCNHAHTVTDDDFAAARGAGLSEDEAFELVVCAAVGEASRQHDAALAALQAAIAQEPA